MSEQSSEHLDRVVENAERCINVCQGPKSSYAGSVADLRASLTAKDAEIERLTRERDELMESLKSACNDRHEANVIALNVQEERDDYKARAESAESAESTVERLTAELDEAKRMEEMALDRADEEKALAEEIHRQLNAAESTVASLRKELDALKNGIRLDRLEAHDAGSYRIAYLDTGAVAAIASTQESHDE